MARDPISVPNRVNTYLPLIAPSFFGSALYIFLLRRFFLTLPLELDDAAKIDGAGLLRIYWQIVLPLSKPALGVVAIYSFTAHWNDFLAPLLYLQSPEKVTVALGMQFFKGQRSVDYAPLMAMSTVALLPQIVVFFSAQRFFVQGIVMTGIKG